MTITPTALLSLPIITTGTESGTWGDVVDNGLTSYLDISIAGGLAITITTANVTLVKTAGTNTATNIGATSAQYAILNISGAKTAARSLLLPITSKQYTINNAGTGGFLLTVCGVTPTTGITMVDGESAVVAWDGTDFVKVSSNLAGVPSINGGQLAGLRNKIINGGMQVAQRGAGPFALTTLYSYLTVNNFFAIMATNAAGGMQQSSDAPTAFSNSLYFYRNSGSNSLGTLEVGQIVESIDIYCLKGKTITFSFYAKASSNFSASGSSISSQVITGTALNATSATLGSWAGQTATNKVNTISTSWVKYSMTATIPSNALSLAVLIAWTPTGTAGASDGVFITGVQLELGSVATEFEQRSYGMELELGQRYLPVIEVGSLTGLAFSATSAAVSCTFLSTARTAATGLIAVGSFQVQYGTGTPISATVAFSEAALQTANIGVTSSGMTAATPIRLFNGSPGAARIIFTGCEL